MTDKMIDNRNGRKLEPLSATDDQLLQAFFADNRMEEIPDDGFSDRVMQALPSLDSEKTVLTLDQDQTLAKRLRLEHLWTAACVAVGVVAAVVCQGWEQIQGWLFSMQTQNLLMLLAGIFVLIMVWGYNELADAR